MDITIQKQAELKNTVIEYLNTCKGKKCRKKQFWSNIFNFSKQHMPPSCYGVSKMNSLLDKFNDILETQGIFIVLRPPFHEDHRDEVVIVESDSDEDISFSTRPISSSTFVHQRESSRHEKQKAEYAKVDMDFLEQMISILQSQKGKCSIMEFRDKYESAYGPRNDLDTQLHHHAEFVACFNDNLLLQPKAYTYQHKEMRSESLQKRVNSRGAARPAPLPWGSGIPSKGSSSSGSVNTDDMASNSGFISFSDERPAASSSSRMCPPQPSHQVQAPHNRYGLNVTRPMAPPTFPPTPIQGMPLPSVRPPAAIKGIPLPPARHPAPKQGAPLSNPLQPFAHLPVIQSMMPRFTSAFNQPHQMAAYASPALMNPHLAASSFISPDMAASNLHVAAPSEWPAPSPRTGPPPGTKITDVKEIIVQPISLPRGARLTTDQVNNQVLECIDLLCEAKEHVSMERLEKFLLQKYQVGHFYSLNLQMRNFDNLPAAKEHNMKIGKINSYIQSFVWGRSMCTLYELKECCRDFHPEKKDFEHLKLGPLQKMPLIHDLFKFPMDEYIPEITSLDLIEHLHNFLDTSKKWTQNVSVDDYMKYLVEFYHISNGLSLGIRVRSIPLAIGNLKKSKRDAGAARRSCTEELRQFLNRDIQEAFNKFRVSILQTSQDGSLELRRHYLNLSPEDAVRDIISKFELLAHIMMSESHHSHKIDKMLKYFDHFVKSVLDVPIPRMLYHLSVCLSDLQVQECAQEFLEQEAKRQEQQAVVQQAVGTSAQTKKTPPTKVTLAEKIVYYLNRCLEHGSLQLAHLGKIESKVVEDFGFSSFSEMGQARFLEFVLSEPKIKAIMEECGGTVLGSSSGGHETESIYRPSQLELLEFICQSKHSGAAQNQQVENAICEQFHVTDLRHLGHGNITRLCGAAERPGKHVSKEYHVNFEAALCGRLCPTTSRSTGKVGIQGSQTKEMAMACLTNCPLLEDMMGWSHWSLVFQPQFGSLRSFIEKYGGLQDITLEGGRKTAVSDFMALEVEPGKFLKICSQTTQEQLCAVLDSEDPVASAGYLVSHIVANKGLESTPMALLSGHVKSRLLSLHARSSALTNPRDSHVYGGHHTTDLAVEFVTQMLLHLPVRICVAIANQILLEPLSSVVGSAKSKKEIAQACRLPAQLHRLELLGCLLGLPEWTSSLQFKVQFPASNVTDVMDEEMIGQTILDIHADEESDPKEDSDSEDSDIDSILSDDAENSQQVLLEEMTVEEEETKKEEDESKVNSEETSSDGDEDSDEEEEHEDAGEDEESVDEETLELQISDGSGEESSMSESLEEGISGAEDAEADKEDQEELTREQICQRVVKTIQIEEFGLGIELDETGTKLMKKQQERQGRSLQRLSTDLYSKETHFVLELIQNADDNSYEDDCSPAVKFVIDYSGVTVLNNEMGFEEKNIRALCDVGKSTKEKHKFGYIGQKGIGFKSVFRVTGRPEVHSNGFHICFDVASGPMGYILPHWISESTEDEGWQTRIALPWTEEIKQQIHTHAARFNDIQPSLLLFLHRLKEITIENKVEGSVMCMQRKDLPDKEVQISHSGGTDRWLVLRKILDASGISLHTKSGVEVESSEIALAFPLQKTTAVHSQAKPDKLPVFAFLPLRSYGFRFIVQGDFDVPSSREDVDRDSSWNQWLRNEIHVLFVEALDVFKTRPDLSPIKALIMYLQFIPLEGEVMGFFKPVATKILALLRAKECMPILTGDKKNLQWKIPSKTVITKDSLVLEIISPDLLQRHLGLYYLHPDVASVLDDALIDALGVESVTTEHLLLIGQSIGLNWDDNGGSEQVTELAKWLACVYRSLDDFQDNTPTIDKLCGFRIIPLSEGTLVSLSDVTVFMLSDGRSEVNTKTKKKGNAPDPLFELKKDLKIVHTGLINTSDDEVNSQVVKLLLKMGIKQMTAHDLIHSHIVPVLKSEAWKEKKREVLISYIVYIKTELERNPSVVDWSELRAVARIATNQGVKSPQTDDVHFSSVFGNKFDLRSIFPGIEWTLVDSAYLPHSRTQLDVQSWHNFLSELGVVDFLRVRRTELSFDKSNIHETAWAVFKDMWPDSPDGYTVIDFQCEEFHKLVTANQRADHKYGHMVTLYEILDMEWDGKYRQYAHTQLKSRSGHVLRDVIKSSFATYLETLAWIPSLWKSMTIHEDNKKVTCSATEDLRPPAELYILDSGIENLLAHTVKYLNVPPQKKSSFTEYLKIKSSVDVKIVKEALISWCSRSEASMDTPKIFSTTIKHVLELYMYLSDSLSNKDAQDLFHDHPAIFVPVLDRSQVREGDNLVGRMLKRQEVWWSDPTELFTKYRESLELYKSPLAKRKFLQCWYPPLEEMFQRSARVDAEPSTFELSQLLKHIATVNTATDTDVLRDTLFLFSKIGSDLSKITETFGGVKSTEAMKAETNLSKVTSLLSKAAVFPTKQGQWVSLTDNPMVVDSSELEQMFDKRPGVHFLQLEVRESGKPRDRGRRNKIDQESLKFCIGLFDSIKPLSQCVKMEEITSNFKQCIKGQKLMHDVVGLIQRFLYFIFPEVHELVKEKKAGSLKELVFSQVERLEVRYELIDRPDVYEIRQEKCVVKDKNFFFHEQFVNSQTDINREVAKYFSEGNEDCMRELRNFLSQVVPILEGSSDETVDELLARQKRPIRNLPSDEEVWEIPPPIIEIIPEPEPEVVEEQVQTMFYSRALSGSGAEKATSESADGENTEIKSWPPRSALFKEQTEHSKKQADGQSGIWPPPQGPSYATLSKQLPSSIKFEKADQEEGADATNPESEKRSQSGASRGSRNTDEYRMTKQGSEAEDKGTARQTSHPGQGRGTARQTSDGGAKDESGKTGTSGDGRSVHRSADGVQRQTGDGEFKHDGSRGGRAGGAHRTEEGGPDTGDSNQGMDAASTGDKRKRKLTESSREDETGDVKRLNSQEDDGKELNKQQLDKGTNESQDVAESQSAGHVLPAERDNMEEGRGTAVITRHDGSSSREVTPSSSGSSLDVRRPNKKGTLQFTIPVWSESSEDVSYTELSKGHDLTIPPINLSEESPPADIGQWGEKLVWDYLQQQRLSNTHIVEIVWANSCGETGLPYDFEIVFSTDSVDNTHRLYIEVKSTLSWDKEVFPVSSKQIEFALQNKDHYEIYRVFGAGNRNPKLVRVDNVAEKMRSHAVRLFMVL